jgi:hypothetical protein
LKINRNVIIVVICSGVNSFVWLLQTSDLFQGFSSMTVERRRGAHGKFPILPAALVAALSLCATSRAQTFTATIVVELPAADAGGDQPMGGIDDCGIPPVAGSGQKYNCVSMHGGLTDAVPGQPTGAGVGTDTTQGVRNTIPAGSTSIVLQFLTSPLAADAVDKAENYTQAREILALSSRLFQRAAVLHKYTNGKPHPYTISIVLPADVILFLPLAGITCSQIASQCAPKISIPLPTCTTAPCQVCQDQKIKQALAYTQADQIISLSERFYGNALISK